MRLAAILALTVLSGGAVLAEDRVGFAETFDTSEGWIPGMDPTSPDPRYLPKSFKSENGRFVIETKLRVLRGIRESYFRDRNIPVITSITRLSKKYDDEVDLDRYHYLVAHMPSSQAHAMLVFNNKATKVLYTTGVRAQDLRHLGLTGKQKIGLQLIIGDNTGRVVLDEIRLVSDLADEERKGLIPRGYAVRPQKLKCGPYQGLEALYQRRRAPLTELLKNEKFAGGPGRAEWTVFHDEATNAPILKLTRWPGSDFGDYYALQTSANGRWCIFVATHRRSISHVLDLRTRRIISVPFGRYIFFPKTGDKAAQVSIARDREKGGGRITVAALDVRTMESSMIVDEYVRDMPPGMLEYRFSPDSNKMVIGFREYDVCYIIDPEASRGSRLRFVKLPYPLKGLHLINNDRFLGFANCYTYQAVYYDYQADKTYPRSGRLGGGHTAAGKDVNLGPYGNIMKLVVPRLDYTDTPGDSIRVHGNYYDCNVKVDYGTVSPDSRWAFQDGTHGDVADQIVGFDLHEPGNAIPVFFHNTSSTGWDVKPYVRVTPDCTKIRPAASDMLGDGDVYMVPFQRPEPPRDITVTRTGKDNRINWRPALRSAETWGYNVYHSAKRTIGFVRLNDKVIEVTEYVHVGGHPDSVYLLTAVENSRLESRFSAPAMLPSRRRDDTVAIFLEAELPDEATVPFRRQYDGYAGNFGTMRLMPETPEEIEGTLTFAISVDRFHAAGKRSYRVALHCRTRTDIYEEMGGKDAPVEVGLDGRLVGRILPGETSQLAWCALKHQFQLGPGGHQLAIKSRAPGVEIDRLALFSSDADMSWLKAGPHDPEPEVAAKLVEYPNGVTVKADGPYATILSWPATKEAGLDYYSIYASAEGPPVPSNETLVGSTDDTKFRDTGLRPRTKLNYLVLGYDTRGRAVVSYRGSGATAAGPKIYSIRLAPDKAELEKELELCRDDGRTFIKARKINKDQEKAYAHMTFTLDVPAAGEYAAWCYHRVRSDLNYVNVAVDKTAGGYQLTTYGKPGRGITSGISGDRWYVTPIMLRMSTYEDGKATGRKSQDVFHLEAGQHRVQAYLPLRPTSSGGSKSPEIGEIVITNDLTWWPEDYNPRAQFLPEQ